MREPVTLLSLVCNMRAVSPGMFTLSLGVISRLCAVIVALPGHLIDYFCCMR